MKLAQRIAFGYFKTKFNTLGAISPRKAAEAAFTLFCTPYHGKPKRKAPAIFNDATKLEFIFDFLTIRGFHWQAKHPTHKKILICHGFDSCCYKFDAYIPLLLEKGFDVFAFDAPGHGISDGKTINALLYSKLIHALENHYGPFYGIMAHSLGGLAVSLTLEHMANNEPKKVVLIAPATETTSAVDNFFRYIPLLPKVQQAFHQFIFEINHTPTEWYSVTRAIQNVHSKVLWLHDKYDAVCAYEDTKAARKLHLANVQFLTTQNLGHSNIYRQPEIQEAIIDFFSNDDFNVKNISLKEDKYEWM